MVGDGEGEVDELIAFSSTDDWGNDDYLYWNYILNRLKESLYPVYDVYKTTKQLWVALDHKYRAEDVGSKKLLVAKFLIFTMVDSKPLVNQVKEL
ncbi:hypothetical protein GQ457_10G013290 [Hibiscus cannabinus]